MGGIGGGDTKTGLIRDSLCGRHLRELMFDTPFFHFITFFVAVLDQGRERFNFEAFFPLGSRGYVGSDVSTTVFCSARDV